MNNFTAMKSAIQKMDKTQFIRLVRVLQKVEDKELEEFLSKPFIPKVRE